MKNPKDPIENPTWDLPACSAVVLCSIFLQWCQQTLNVSKISTSRWIGWVSDAVTLSVNKKFAMCGDTGAFIPRCSTWSTNSVHWAVLLSERRIYQQRRALQYRLKYTFRWYMLLLPFVTTINSKCNLLNDRASIITVWSVRLVSWQM
jgi:hypothetical protein